MGMSGYIVRLGTGLASVLVAIRRLAVVVLVVVVTVGVGSMSGVRYIGLRILFDEYGVGHRCTKRSSLWFGVSLGREELESRAWLETWVLC